MMASVCCLILLSLAPERPDLVGKVVDDKGKPVVGAYVMIESASVRQGTSALCPSCYLDCGKSDETGEDGSFRLRSLDPELLFTVLVAADGYQPTFARKADPLEGPIEVKLSRLDVERLEPRKVLRGVVLGPDGKPLAGARVSAQGFRTDAYSGFSPDIFDPVAVTNRRGQFVITSNSPIHDADLRVEGSGVAPRIVPGRKPEFNPQRIEMIAGASVTGRLVRDGQPVANAVMGLVQSSRSSERFLGDVTIGTDEQGRFRFSNVHPDEDYYLYGLMGTTGEGAVEVRAIHAGADGSTLKVGDVTVVEGHRVRGHVVLSEEKPVPPKTRVLLSREKAWDTRSAEVDGEGRFEIEGLPTERYSVSIRLKGYRISPRNHSIDPQNPYRLVGTIDQDLDGIKILMEPE